MPRTKLMVLLAIIFLGSVKAVAEEPGNERMPYHTFLKEGKTWNFQYYYRNLRDGEEEEWTKDISYVVNGTTEIEGNTYYNMCRVSEEGSEYHCALREEDRKVWMRTDNRGDRLLYNFGMSAGDSYKLYSEWNTFLLVDISHMRFHDETLNVYRYDVTIDYFGNGEDVDVFPYTVVEGVGCEEGWNIFKKFYSMPANGIIMREDFLSCFEDGKCIFTKEDFESLSTEVQQPKTAGTASFRQATYYSPDGCRLPAPRHGLNIVRSTDGKTKKVILK